MAAAASATGTKSKTVSDEQRRWVVFGTCLIKALSPALRDVLANEIPNWYQTLLQPPCEIDKQTFGKHEKTLRPSTLKLNYESINNNTVHKSRHSYDYTVKDPLSLAKLFMKPHGATFTGFDQTMHTDAVLSVMCEANPFITSGAADIAQRVRKDINELVQGNLSHWTEPNFQAALQNMELLIKKAKLTPAEEKQILAYLVRCKDKGVALCFGQPVNIDNPEIDKTNIHKSETKKDVAVQAEMTDVALQHPVRFVVKGCDRNKYREMLSKKLESMFEHEGTSSACCKEIGEEVIQLFFIAEDKDGCLNELDPSTKYLSKSRLLPDDRNPPNAGPSLVEKATSGKRGTKTFSKVNHAEYKETEVKLFQELGISNTEEGHTNKLCNKIDEKTKQLLGFDYTMQNLKECVKLCKNLVHRRVLQDWAIKGNDLMKTKGFKSWRNHVNILVSEAALLVALWVLEMIGRARALKSNHNPI